MIFNLIIFFKDVIAIIFTRPETALKELDSVNVGKNIKNQIAILVALVILIIPIANLVNVS